MNHLRYHSMLSRLALDRRQFLKVGGAAGAGLMLGNPAAWGAQADPPPRPKTNIDEAVAVPRTERSLPGAWPGRVAAVHDPKAMSDAGVDAGTVQAMFERGMRALSGGKPEDAFHELFTCEDIVGIKVNPVGAGLISTRLELVDAVIAWLTAGGLPRGNIVIWDRFDYMLAEAGFTAERYPGIECAGLQTMDESAFEEGAEQSGWLGPDGHHLSEANWDPDVFYWADVQAPQDPSYLHQHVVNGKKSLFGKLLTQRLTKIINLPVLKNTGNGVSVATKNLGYGAICNTGRLHEPLFFNVCTEVLAFPVIRDKLVLNIADGLRGQYEGGPMPAAEHCWFANTLHFASDPFALDRVCHDLLVDKRKAMGIKVNEHLRFTDYLRYAESLGLGVADPARIVRVSA